MISHWCANLCVHIALYLIVVPIRVGQRYDDLYDDLMVQIDTIILSGYALPDWLEAKLMDFIGSAKRPHLVFEFR